MGIKRIAEIGVGRATNSASVLATAKGLAEAAAAAGGEPSLRETEPTRGGRVATTVSRNPASAGVGFVLPVVGGSRFVAARFTTANFQRELLATGRGRFTRQVERCFQLLVEYTAADHRCARGRVVQRPRSAA